MSRMKTRIWANATSLFVFVLLLLSATKCTLASTNTNTHSEPRSTTDRLPSTTSDSQQYQQNDFLPQEPVIIPKIQNPTPKYLPDCSSDEAVKSRNIFLISTLDGNLSAIDAVGGKVLWTTKIADTLLSSTISDFMINPIGETVRIVPSLDGNLFVHNGKTIKQTPYSAEKMLRKSLKFTENVILVGGKDSQALGIDLSTGKIIYECGLKSCSPGDNYTRDNVIVLRRNFQSIRAINIGNGAEDWHYQVNDPEILTVSKPNCQGSSQAEADDVRLDFRIVIPCGIIRTQVYRKNSSNEDVLEKKWSHKFNNPIVKFWHLKDGKLKSVDLFDESIIEIQDAISKQDFEEPQLYIGSFKNQLYVQKSIHYRETVSLVQDDQSVLIKQDVLNEKNTAIIQVQWKPKLAIEGPLIPPQKDDTPMDENQTHHEMATVSGFPFLAFNREDSTGYYLFRVKNKEDLCDRLPKTENNTALKDSEEEELEEPIQQIINIVINNSLSHYWMEVTFLCFGSWIVFHHVWRAIQNYLNRLFCKKQALLELNALESYSNHETLVKKIEHEISVQTDSTTFMAGDSIQPEPEPQPKIVAFNSRFYEDFNPVSQLGKGGFGVVFEAEHKIDGQRYAVKRVAMPTKGEKRTKFMREVRFLSDLEHPGIVRYYNAWIEEPPPGWQDDKDQEWSFEFSKVEQDTYFDESRSLVSESGNIQSNCANSYDDSLVSFRNNNTNNFNNEDDDDDLSISFRNENDDITSGSESDDEAQNDDSNDDKENQESCYFDKQNSSSDIDIVFEETASGGTAPQHVNWDVSVIDKYSNDSTSSKHLKRRRRKSSEKSDRPPKQQIYVYIQMQLCKKITLRDWLMNAELRKQEEWLHIFRQILSAVDYVHEKKLIHRDLKPSNIFFSMDNTVKIGDFGLVTSILDDSSDSTETDQKLNRTKRAFKHTNEVGTHIYMSPEQIKKLPYNHKVDIFSIGIILYELLEQFNTDSERVRKLEKVRRKDFPEDFQQKYQKECKILHKLLSLDPDERPEAKEILENIFQHCSDKK